MPDAEVGCPPSQTCSHTTATCTAHDESVNAVHEGRVVDETETREDDPVPAAGHILDSALLVQPGVDTDYEPEWTPVDHIGRHSIVTQDVAPKPEPLRAEEPTVDNLGGSLVFLIRSECATSDPLENAQPSATHDTPSVTVDVTPDDALDILPETAPSHPSTKVPMSHLSPSAVANAQPASTPIALDVGSDVYIGPLPNKPPRVRVHTPENPDWAVAPDEPPRPRVYWEAPRSSTTSQGKKATATGGQGSGAQKKGRGSGSNQNSRANGKGAKAKSSGGHPSTFQKKAAPAKVASVSGSGAGGEPVRRRSARLAQV
ncbi:hypothetical protein C8Q77DRAFT_125769 [Trametes polyzona]|nr:hypothetical protein C8Q77DRAFT_125769 [Trametes polyzona]